MSLIMDDIAKDIKKTPSCIALQREFMILSD